MTKFLVASSGHKHLLTAARACQCVADGLRAALPHAAVRQMPLADGGEGTIDVMVAATGGSVTTVRVSDPLCRPREARMGLLGQGRGAVIEIAEAAGSALLAPQERQTMVATSFGVGEMIRAAVDRGCTRIVVGLGGCIASDMGMGMAQALGVTFSGRGGQPLHPFPGPAFNALSLMDVHTVDTRTARTLLRGVRVMVASDVDIPLLGPGGQARTFGPQKGADEREIAWLERAFAHLAERVRAHCGVDVDVPLAGAAGGMGAGFLGLLGAELLPGARVVAEAAGLEAAIREADVVVVGEGCLDVTTMLHKAPGHAAAVARAMGRPVLAVVGRVQPGVAWDDLSSVTSCFDFSCNADMLDEATVAQALTHAATRAAQDMPHVRRA